VGPRRTAVRRRLDDAKDQGLRTHTGARAANRAAFGYRLSAQPDNVGRRKGRYARRCALQMLAVRREPAMTG
jgi:hypothetical protein